MRRNQHKLGVSNNFKSKKGARFRVSAVKRLPSKAVKWKISTVSTQPNLQSLLFQEYPTQATHLHLSLSIPTTISDQASNKGCSPAVSCNTFKELLAYREAWSRRCCRTAGRTLRFCGLGAMLSRPQTRVHVCLSNRDSYIFEFQILFSIDLTKNRNRPIHPTSNNRQTTKSCSTVLQVSIRKQ